MGAFTNIFPFHRNIVFPFAPVVVVPSVSQNFVKYLNQQNFCQLNGCLVNSKVIHVFSLLFF